MKRFLSVSLFVLAMVRGALGGPAQFYVNDGIVIATNLDNPVIDAINFVNNNYFDVFTLRPFQTSDTLNYTNKGLMIGSPGFDFRTMPASFGIPKMAANFNNKVTGTNGGIINCSGFGSFFLLGGVGTIFGTVGNLSGSSQFLVQATNIYNTGAINMDASSLIRLKGKNVDLSRGSLSMSSTLTFLFGINIPIFLNFAPAGLDNYWGVGPTNYDGPMIPSIDLTTAASVTSPLHWVTNRNYFRNSQYLSVGQNFFGTGQDAHAYVQESGTVSNRLIQAVWIANTNSAFTSDVFFDPFEIAVQWKWTTTNQATSLPTTNYMVLTDDFGEITNAPAVAANGVVGARFTFKPIFYQMYFNNADLAFPPFFVPATEASDFDLQAIFGNIPPATNQYAAYSALVTPATQFPGDNFGGDVTNLAGRIEIQGDTSLNLTGSRISALNSLMLQCTNNYLGNKGAIVSSPFYNINLGSKTGFLTMSNLVPGQLNHPDGVVYIWSGRWTNNINSITNSYHVLMVQTLMAPTATPYIKDLSLKATNLVISDICNVNHGLLLDAQRITLTSNNVTTATSTSGQLNLFSGSILWPSSLPRLQYFTNWGAVNMLNAAFFGGDRNSPFFDHSFGEPYVAFVNHGGITNQGSLIWSKYFENTGSIDAGLGAITVRSASRSFLVNGIFRAVNNDISLEAQTLVVTNHPLFAGAALNLWITNSITDGGNPTNSPGTLTNLNGNIWTAADGFNLFIKPPTGDLLGTIVTNISPPFAETDNFWAGEDRGPSNAGFTNNVAVGRLVLNGITNSAFHFIGTGEANAIYVDVLELQGTAADIGYDGTGYVLPAFDFEDNIKIYYADALINGQSVAEHINGANNGHLVWVNGFAGNFSTVTLYWTNDVGVVFPYTMNEALRNSTFIDSDGDGLVNAIDPTPLGDPPASLFTKAYSSALVRLKVALTNSPKTTALVSWNTLPNSTNFLYYKTSYAATNWLKVTNFVYKGTEGRVTIKDPIKSTGQRFYRVRVDPRKK